MIVKLTKEEAKRLIDDNVVTVYFENYWRYPKTGDDQKTCPMLDMMFNIERREGYVIHITPKVAPMSKNVITTADFNPPVKPEPVAAERKHIIPSGYKKGE